MRSGSRQPGCTPIIQTSAFQHPVAVDDGLQCITGVAAGRGVGEVVADGADPFAMAVTYAADGQGRVPVGTNIASDHRHRAGAVFQQAQIALAGVERIVFQRCDCQIKLQ